MIPEFVIRRDTLIMSLGFAIYRHMELSKGFGKETMTSREFAEFTGRRHDSILRTIARNAHAYNDIYTEHQLVVSEYKDGTGRALNEYVLNKSQTLFIASRIDAKVHARVQKRWEELETKEQNKFSIPQTLSEALLLASKQAERIEQLEVKEKVVDRLLSSNTSISITEFAKCYCDDLHNIGGKRLFSLLRDRKHLINSPGNPKHNTPYQKYINSGYYTVIQKAYKRGDKDSYSLQTLITPKGQEWLLSNLDKIIG